MFSLYSFMYVANKISTNNPVLTLILSFSFYYNKKANTPGYEYTIPFLHPLWTYDNVLCIWFLLFILPLPVISRFSFLKISWNFNGTHEYRLTSSNLDRHSTVLSVLSRFRAYSGQSKKANFVHIIANSQMFQSLFIFKHKSFDKVIKYSANMALIYIEVGYTNKYLICINRCGLYTL